MEADPATVLEWIKCSECRDLQITALEQLCTEILFSDNVDEFMRRYSYASIISATTQVFADELAPDYLLEANARTLTYCLEMADTNAIHTIKERDLRIMCTRLDAVDMMSEKSNEVGQQIVKMLELITNHIPVSVYRAGGLTSVLRFVQLYSERIHADVLQAGMNLVKTLCSHCEPTDPSLDTWIEALSALLNHHEQRVIDNALQSLASIVNRFARAGRDPTPVATAELIDQLSHHLSIAGGAACGSARKSVPGFDQLDVNASFASFRGLGGLGDQGKTPDPGLSNPALIDALTSLLLTLCCNSAAATQRLLSPENHLASTLATILLYGEDSIVSSVFRLVEVLIYILGEGRAAETCEGLRSRHHSHNAPELLPRPLPMDQEDKSQLHAGDATPNQPSFSPLEREAAYRAAVEAIRKQDKETFDSLLSDRALDLHHLDNRGQTLLNWAASFGTPYMVEQLCLRGADVKAGARTSLDYAAGFGRVEVCELLLKHGANPNLYDVEGLRPIDRARLKRDDPSAMAVVKLLEAQDFYRFCPDPTPGMVGA
ncbi:E3 ubiquitin-protein ligase HTD1 [Sparganum proliferum]